MKNFSGKSAKKFLMGKLEEMTGKLEVKKLNFLLDVKLFSFLAVT
jgi:hypothetical protein